MPEISNKGRKIYVTHINIRQSIFIMLMKLVFLDLMVALVGMLYFFFVSNQVVETTLSGSLVYYNLSFLLVLFILKIALAVYIIMLWLNEYYEIWPGHVVHKSGFFLRRAEKHPFPQMRSVKVEQGILGKIFGFGTIYLYNWYLKTNTSLYLIHNPIKYFRIIEDLIPKSEEEKGIFLDKLDSDE